MVALRSAVIALVVVLGACDVGEVPPAGGGPDAGAGGTQAQKFDSVIKPLVTRCTACHGTTQAPNFTSYQTLDMKYRTPPGSGNILVTKGDPTAGMHQGIQYFSAQDKMTVANWIDGK
jgi:cytochrome c553